MQSDELQVQDVAINSTNGAGIVPNVPENKPTVIEGSAEDIEENTEEKEIEEVKKNYKLTPKFNKWCQLFFDKENEQTYLNKTQSAIEAYNLDPKEQYFVGSKIGQQNYQKLSNVASEIGQRKGYTVEKWLDKAWLNTLKSDNPIWWDRIGEVMGWRDPKQAPVIQNNIQNNTQINVSEAERKSFNDQFRDFVKNR